MAKDRTYKMTTLVGESESGIEDAIKAALKTSSQKVRGLEWAQVNDIRANLGSSGKVERWQVQVEAAFEVEKN